jgi:hypothetical protein
VPKQAPSLSSELFDRQTVSYHIRTGCRPM